MYADYDGNEPITVAMVVTAAIIGAIIGGVTYVGINLYNGTAITWGGLAQSILVGAVSGVASMSIGAVAQSVATTIFGTSGTKFVNMALLAVTKGAMHGAAQGIIQGVSGGNAGQSFITAMATSIAGDAFGAIGGKVGEYSNSIVGHSLFGAVVGGVVSNMQGGNFWEGAAIGLTAGLLNHAGKKLYPAIDRMLQGKRPSPEEVLRNINEGLPAGEVATFVAADKIKNAGVLNTINESIPGYKGFKYTHAIMSNTGKVLGVVGYLGAGTTIVLDYRQMQAGKISATRFSYNTTGTLSSVATGFVVGGEFGLLPGAVAGAVVGSIFSVGQMAYDAWNNTIWPQFVQFENALNSGWRPSR
jgi:hypothetical protein